MATVYITQQPVKNRRNWVPNLEPATHYGKLQYIFSGDDKPFQNPRTSILHASRYLASFDWQNDFLLWPNTGDPASFMAAILALTELLYDDAEYIQFLYWERKRTPEGHSSREGFYVPIRFPLNVVSQMLNQERKTA